MTGDNVPRPRIVQIPPPTSDNSRYIPVVSAKVGITLRVVLLGGYTFTCETHWVDNRTVPHFEPAENCPGCIRKHRKRWKGYLSGWLPGPSRLCIVEITAEAARNCPALFNGKQELRGRVLSLTRLGRAANAPVRAEFGQPPPKDGIKNLPGPFNLAAALYRLWDLSFDCINDGPGGPGQKMTAYEMVDLTGAEEEEGGQPYG